MRRRITVAVLALCAVMAAGAPVLHAKTLEAKYRSLRAEVVQKHGERAPGRNIVRDGVRTKHGAREARRAEIAESIDTLKRMLAPPPVVVAPTSTSAPTTSELQSGASAGVSSSTTPASTGGGSSNAMVDPSCESGGNPQVVDPSGTYWGKYQFDRGTWAANGGNPSTYGSASEAEQDQVASRVTYDAWPNC